ncbi:MAG: hypothetical protein ACJ764_05840 [Solirubrobacteraceae bacterium]
MAAFAAVCFVTLGAAAGACAQAHRTTHVSFVISKNQTADTPEHYTYSVRNAPRGSVIVLQRQRGGGWKTLRKFTRHSGHGSITQSIGEYVLRVAVLKNHHVRAQKQRTVFVYGDIPFSALCDAANVQWGNNDRGCNRSTAQVGARLFPSAATFDAPGSSSPSAPAHNITVTPSTSCRTMHLDYGESNDDVQHAGGETMITQTLIQQNTDPVSVTFPGGAEQSTDFQLDGGPFQITDESNFTGSGSLKVLENGSLNCYTTNGVVPGSI